MSASRRSYAGPLAFALALLVAASPGCRRREGADTPEEMKAKIAALEQEVPVLRAKLGDLVERDHRLQGMPLTGVRVGVPTPLARTMIERVVSGFVDSVTLRLANLKVHKEGTVKKVVTLGQYELAVVIAEVVGRLKTGKPQVAFGGNQVRLSLPVKVVAGEGNANINFKWDGKNVSGMVCGDMEVNEDVAGKVKPAEYPVAGALELTATTRQILAAPKFPVVKVNLKVEPSDESWAAVQKILDDKGGVCGFVVDKVDIRSVLEGLIGKGFNIRLPTEKIKPMAIPVGIAPTLRVGDEVVTITVKVSDMAITEHMIWLGADVTLAQQGPAPATPEKKPARSPARPPSPAPAKPSP